MSKYDGNYDCNAMTYEQKVELYDRQFRSGYVTARADQPNCVASMIVRDLVHQATRLGKLQQQANVFGNYHPERLERDISATDYCVQLMQDILTSSINKEMDNSLKHVQEISALTLKAALSGAFTDKG